MTILNLNNRVKIKLNDLGIHILNKYYKTNHIIEWDRDEIQTGYFVGQFTTLMKIFGPFFRTPQAVNILPFENFNITMYDDHNWKLDENGRMLPIKQYNFSLIDYVKIKIKNRIIFELHEKEFYFQKETQISLLQLIQIFGQYVTSTKFPLESLNAEFIIDLHLEESEDLTRKGV